MIKQHSRGSSGRCACDCREAKAILDRPISGDPIKG